MIDYLDSDTAREGFISRLQKYDFKKGILKIDTTTEKEIVKADKVYRKVTESDIDIGRVLALIMDLSLETKKLYVRIEAYD